MHMYLSEGEMFALSLLERANGWRVFAYLTALRIVDSEGVGGAQG